MVGRWKLWRSAISPEMWKGHDLALAAVCHAVAAGEALDEQAGARDTVAFPHDVLLGPEVLDLHGQSGEHLLLLIREGEDALQLRDEGLAVGVIQDRAP